MFDVLRSDNSIASNGLESRTPFLDKTFVQMYLSIPPHIRFHGEKPEKYLLREAFKNTNLLPDTILFRPKEAFSDGVSSLQLSLYEIIQNHIQNNLKIQKILKEPYPFLKIFKTKKTDNTVEYYPLINTPKTDEQRYYRKIFCQYFKDFAKVIPYFWMPKYINASDASARTLSIYNVGGKKSISNN